MLNKINMSIIASIRMLVDNFFVWTNNYITVGNWNLFADYIRKTCIASTFNSFASMTNCFNVREDTFKVR
jgi:hypothetical protein